MSNRDLNFYLTGLFAAYSSIWYFEAPPTPNVCLFFLGLLGVSMLYRFAKYVYSLTQ